MPCAVRSVARDRRQAGVFRKSLYAILRRSVRSYVSRSSQTPEPAPHLEPLYGSSALDRNLVSDAERYAVARVFANHTAVTPDQKQHLEERISQLPEGDRFQLYGLMEDAMEEAIEKRLHDAAPDHTWKTRFRVDVEDLMQKISMIACIRARIQSSDTHLYEVPGLKLQLAWHRFRLASYYVHERAVSLAHLMMGGSALIILVHLLKEKYFTNSRGYFDGPMQLAKETCDYDTNYRGRQLGPSERMSRVAVTPGYYTYAEHGVPSSSFVSAIVAFLDEPDLRILPDDDHFSAQYSQKTGNALPRMTTSVNPVMFTPFFTETGLDSGLLQDDPAVLQHSTAISVIAEDLALKDQGFADANALDIPQRFRDALWSLITGAGQALGPSQQRTTEEAASA
eukprot:TRINITY_DN26355_c0_g1_i1.p1 TRINITY_DN26355_c0_g1~~TRINITY_DN26355_c0_g1_i1.p1  ORF type:complete len:421 (+),score=44.07 TRINITY_DN26355_c0_g1_i1:77-1264(+)